MAGVSHTFFKCPFCGKKSGVEIGSCLDGRMTVKDVPKSLLGYPNYTTSVISYEVVGPPLLNRRAYIPNTTEGRKVVDLLRVAWDRRLCFSMGTSVTTRVENTLVWNIHHKSSTKGEYGYPDPNYLTRVQDELAQYGIQ